MDSFKDILKNRKETGPKPPKYKWQELAMQICHEFSVKDRRTKASVFKYCKKDYGKALKCFQECKELGKPHAHYFFKLFTLK